MTSPVVQDSTTITEIWVTIVMLSHRYSTSDLEAQSSMLICWRQKTSPSLEGRGPPRPARPPAPGHRASGLDGPIHWLPSRLSSHETRALYQSPRGGIHPGVARALATRDGLSETPGESPQPPGRGGTLRPASAAGQRFRLRPLCLLLEEGDRDAVCPVRTVRSPGAPGAMMADAGADAPSSAQIVRYLPRFKRPPFLQ